ncbi:MAG: hypothetical protein HYZ57_01180 [Acidobacteria bacterium]|nr:hypothetical protein [Acidobacteriota bacterium]
MSSDLVREFSIPLDERNLAHVLSGVALAALASRNPGTGRLESECWWSDRGFALRTPLGEACLFQAAHEFVRSLSWIPGMGSAEQGTFVAGTAIGSNPFISLADDGQETSPFKTFSGQVTPQKLLTDQQDLLETPDTADSWLFQVARGAGSWGLDCRVGSHAYDQGFSSNDEGSGDLDPIYPAVELLSIAAASFFAAIHAWQFNEATVSYSIWVRPISLSLVPYVVAGRLDGFPARRYRTANRGAAYGKGAAYRFFPEATFQDQR